MGRGNTMLVEMCCAFFDTFPHLNFSPIVQNKKS